MKRLLLLIFSLYFISAKAQTIFTYGSTPVSKDEFLRVYQKNNHTITYDEKSVREYLELYENFKLKVKAAEVLGMDTLEGFKQELEGYRKQLAQPYLTSKKVTDLLVKEAYDRMLFEIKASHILINCGPNDMPKDTLAAYKKAMDIRDKVMKGVLSFDSAAYNFSDDPSATRNLGNLGFFTAFNMIYSFESGAYNTAIGDISAPIRTQFGYHLIKVTDRRAARGEVKIAHIMVNISDPNREKIIAETDTTSSRSKIFALYERLKKGEKWDDLCKQFSEDFYTNQNGGLLNWISSTSRYPEEIKAASFSLKNDNDISEPIKSEFGWHIVKRLEIKAASSFEEMREGLMQKIQRDGRSDINKTVVIDSIKIANQFKEVDAAFADFLKLVDSTLLNGLWKIDSAVLRKLKGKTMFSLGTQKLTQYDFANYIMSYQTPQKKTSIQAITSGMYKDFLSNAVYEYAERNLAETNQAFKYIYKEYRDGILLFDLTDKMVWSKAVSDTVGLQKFYEAHAHEHIWKERIEVTKYDCADKQLCKRAYKMVSKGIETDSILDALNKTNALNITIKKGKYERGENASIDSLKWVKGSQKISDTRFAIVHQVMPSQTKLLSEARGTFTSEYQNYLEKQWIMELREKYPIVVDEEVVKSILK